MDYFKTYNELIAKYGSNYKIGYMERHHIQPKCMGGDNSIDNLTYLAPRLHLLAHQLLMHAFPDVKGLKIAFATMCSRKGIRLTSRQYQTAREAVSGDNSMLARAVTTPLGYFPTVTAAAAAHGVNKAIISKKAGSKSILHQGYYWTDNPVIGNDKSLHGAHLRKGVRTPFGDFESTREAGRMMGINHSTITKRIKRGDQGYSYI